MLENLQEHEAAGRNLRQPGQQWHIGAKDDNRRHRTWPFRSLSFCFSNPSTLFSQGLCTVGIFFFSFFLILFYVCMFCGHAYLCTLCIAWCLQRLEEGTGSPGTRVTGGCKQPCRYWASNCSPFPGQQVSNHLSTSLFVIFVTF